MLVRPPEPQFTSDVIVIVGNGLGSDEDLVDVEYFKVGHVLGHQSTLGVEGH